MLNIFLVLTGGLIWIPIAFFLLTLFGAYKIYKGYKSGTVRQEQDKNSSNWGKNVVVPGKSIDKWWLWFTIFFFLAAIGSYFKIHSDYRKSKPNDEKRWEKQKEKEQK